jgi:hypothetical protein
VLAALAQQVEDLFLGDVHGPGMPGARAGNPEPVRPRAS